MSCKKALFETFAVTIGRRTIDVGTEGALQSSAVSGSGSKVQSLAPISIVAVVRRTACMALAAEAFVHFCAHASGEPEQSV